MTHSLSGKTVVVIGGSSGIGAAVAKAAAARGAQVVLAGRRVSSGVENGVRSEPVDVTDSASLQRLFEAVGRFDHLVYTAGPSVRAKKLIDTDLEEMMSLAQRVSSMVLALRRKVSIKVRQPVLHVGRFMGLGAELGGIEIR